MNNPELKNINRPGYELPRLLRHLGIVNLSTHMTPPQRQLTEAVRVHAFNQQATVASGIDSIGQLIYLAGNSSEVVDPHHMRNLGLLISHLAVQLEHLIDLGSEMENNLAPDLENGGDGK